MNPREAWAPEMAATSGIRPWEVGRLTPREFGALQDHYQAMSREAQNHG